jgi:hypothetical protein
MHFTELWTINGDNLPELVFLAAYDACEKTLEEIWRPAVLLWYCVFHLPRLISKASWSEVHKYKPYTSKVNVYGKMVAVH